VNDTPFPASRSPESLLLIEDHPLVRAALAVALRTENFDVHAVATATEGLAKLAAFPAIAAVVLEIELGPTSPDGFVFVEAARAVRPDIGIVFLTGRPDLLEGRGPRRDEICLVKPSPVSFIAKAIRTVIAGAVGKPSTLH
jgi:DNA-binding NarL/FixJ family response regulator